MVRISGIGTYIEELVPRVIAQWTQARFTILGDQDVLSRVIPASERVRFRTLDVPIYSIREQIALVRAIPADTSLYWAPHYNIPLLYRGRVAATVHDVFHLADTNASMAKRLYARVMFRALVTRARVVICDSAFTAAELRRFVGEPRALAVIHLGVSPRWFELSNLTRPISRPYFLVVGNVKPHKNLRRLVAAFERVAANIPHRLVIVGRREGLLTLDTEVEAMAKSLGDRVVFTGYLTREELERYVSGCDALVQPSLYEGFGLPPLEAMACGRAVAVSRASSLPEVCGPEADYFDPLDVASMTSALERRALRPCDDAEVAERRRAWARRFDWQSCAQATTIALARATENRTESAA